MTINSANADEWGQINAALAAGEVDLLLVSPERLNNPRFRDEQLPRLADAAGLLVVDEAHCISDWGHDFRPDYRRIRDLLVSMPVGRPVLATTATANQRVVDDVDEQLEAGGAEVRTYRGSLSRASLRLGVLPLPTPEARLGWLTTHLGELRGQRHRLRADGRRSRGHRHDAARRRSRRARLHRAHRPRRPARARAGPARQPGQGTGRDERAGHGFRQA